MQGSGWFGKIIKITTGTCKQRCVFHALRTDPVVCFQNLMQAFSSRGTNSLLCLGWKLVSSGHGNR